jgi:hypothetical protein
MQSASVQANKMTIRLLGGSGSSSSYTLQYYRYRYGTSRQQYEFFFFVILMIVAQIAVPVVKGIVSLDGLLTETIGVQFGPKQSAAYMSYT